MTSVGLNNQGSQTAPVCKTYILKVASRCNLNCSYCYMYNKADQSYRQQPKKMSDDVVDAAIEKAARHCEAHAIPRVNFIFHGGEPLLAGPFFFSRFVRKTRERMPKNTNAVFSVQTNGVLLNEEWCTLFKELEINLGVSIDGPQRFHDKFRVDKKGRGTYASVRRGIGIAKEANCRCSVLSVIDITANPIDILEHLAELEPTSADFLFPDATHDDPPLRSNRTSYGDWLLQVFLEWVDNPRFPYKVRTFDVIARSILGGKVDIDTFGTNPNEALVIETDGSIEAVDVLKICEHGITKNGFSVLENDFDEVFENNLILLYRNSGRDLCSACKACPLSVICGGGYLPHRFSTMNRFDNRSVYCEDLIKLITGIRQWVLSKLPSDVLVNAGLYPLCFDEVLASISDTKNRVEARVENVPLATQFFA